MKTCPDLRLPAALARDACPELRAAAEAALAGGQIVAEMFDRGVQMRSKSGEASYNLVSDADVESERAIVRVLSDRFPQHAIVAEEEHAGTEDAEFTWIVDPLDGTNNFAHRIPHFAVCVGGYRHGRPLCGVVVNPIRGDWFWAAYGRGAFHNGHPLRVDEARSLDQVLVGCGFFYDRGAMMEATLAALADFFRSNVHGIRRFGTASLDFCCVAEGMFGAFFEYQLQPWDFAAARIIVEEAGGCVTSALGTDLQLRTSSVLVSNGHLHNACLEIVARHHP